MKARWFLGPILLITLSAGAQQLAITFDDLPAHDIRPPEVSRLQIAQSIIATLNQNHLPPTYGFINAQSIQESPRTEQVLKAWVDGGQLLANHTWSHPSLNTQTPAQFARQIQRNEPMLHKYMAGRDWHWFRYPFLLEGNTVEKRRAVRSILAARGYRIAEVNMDFGDWMWNAPYMRCVAQHNQPAIAHMHDTYLAAAEDYIPVFRQLSQQLYGRDVNYILLLHVGAFDARMFPELLDLYRRHGFTFISLQQAEQDPAYQDDPDLGDPSGGAQLEQMATKRNLDYPKVHHYEQELANTCRWPNLARTRKPSAAPPVAIANFTSSH